jgi:hypothetical protein
MAAVIRGGLAGLAQTTGEQLTTDHVDRITSGLGVSPTNSLGTSEALMGTAPPGTDVFDFSSDVAIIEYVDADDRPVPTGQTADHILITNLFVVTTIDHIARDPETGKTRHFTTA